MKSISIYDLLPNQQDEQKPLEPYSKKSTELINNVDEELNTQLTLNELLQNGYRGFSVLTDKVYSMNVRVFGQYAQQVIQQELYQAFFKEKNMRPNGIGALVTLCKAEDSISVKEVLETHFNMHFAKHGFNILKIIEKSNDVRNAKFNVKIETVRSISMKGTRVHDTHYYERLLNNGELKAVIVTFDAMAGEVTFRISTDGKILLYSDLNVSEILDLVELLLNIEHEQ